MQPFIHSLARKTQKAVCIWEKTVAKLRGSVSCYVFSWALIRKFYTEKPNRTGQKNHICWDMVWLKNRTQTSNIQCLQKEAKLERSPPVRAEAGFHTPSGRRPDLVYSPAVGFCKWHNYTVDWRERWIYSLKVQAKLIRNSPRVLIWVFTHCTCPCLCFDSNTASVLLN